MQQKIISVIGAGDADGKTLQTAEDVGKLIAKRKAILFCGGLGGVMEAAAKGAKSEGGITVGILPQSHREDANPYIDIPVATGFGEGRNVIIIRSADALIAVGGEYGTLSEIALGLKTGKPVIGINTW
ncbi:MAG: TIGR00725 family protein, partial [Nitrospiraceae bacterium]|nr:TIGR00725 family protein [Nitrospirota bacterium]MDA8340388.1 TIGR00725 family protein [Nitrospiraceae bacterium]